MIETLARFIQGAWGSIPWDRLMAHEKELRRSQARAWLAGDPGWRYRIR